MHLKKAGENQERAKRPEFQGRAGEVVKPTEANSSVQVSQCGHFSFLCICVLNIEMLCRGLDQGTICLS